MRGTRRIEKALAPSPQRMWYRVFLAEEVPRENLGVGFVEVAVILRQVPFRVFAEQFW